MSEDFPPAVITEGEKEVRKRVRYFVIVARLACSKVKQLWEKSPGRTPPPIEKSESDYVRYIILRGGMGE